ncbi:MAG: autotransporter outer membrane beta-barrel domain-containing protein [Gemmataceae bacterium]
MSISFGRFWDRRGERKARPIRTRATPFKKKPPTRPTLEALEDRLVPTVAFAPQFGPEQYTGSNNGMQNPPVHLIFSGNWSQSNENMVIAATQNIVSGPYLSKLTQYGSDGKATYADSWTASSTVSGNPSTSALQSFIQNELEFRPNDQPAWYTDMRQAPIYVVLSDPASSGAGQNGGYNSFASYQPFFSLPAPMHMIWVGTGKYSGETNAQWKDVITNTLSHELVETISDPTTSGNIIPGKQLPAGIGASSVPQVADFEPEGSGGPKYGYRLNGDWVAAYWSESDGAFVVPDDNTQTFYLQPIWNKNQFNNQYNLNVYGDQLGANYNDTITVDQTQAGGVEVNLNGQTADFDPGTIQTVTIDTRGGSNQVNVSAVPAGVTVNVTSSHRSSDIVTVGSYKGSLANIAGTVNVSNGFGQTALLVIDGDDPTGQSVGITNNAATFSDMQRSGGHVYYTGAFPNSLTGTMTGVTSLEVNCGGGGNDITVSSTAANTPVTLLPGGGDNNVYIQRTSSAVSVDSVSNDNVVVGYNGSLAGIGGLVNVSNSSGKDSLVIDDAADSSGRGIDISSSAVTFAATNTEPAVTINYEAAQTNSYGTMTGVTALTIWDSWWGNNIEVDSVGPNTTTAIYGYSWDSLYGAAVGQVQFKPIMLLSIV